MLSVSPGQAIAAGVFGHFKRSDMEKAFKFQAEWLSAIESMGTKKEQLAAFYAICNYALRGEMPEENNPFLNLIFVQICKNNKTSKKRSESGSKHTGNQYTAKNNLEQNGTKWNKMEQNGTCVPKEEQENQEKESFPSALPYKEKEIKEKEETQRAGKSKKLNLEDVKAMDFGEWQELVEDWVAYKIEKFGDKGKYCLSGLTGLVNRMKSISHNDVTIARRNLDYSKQYGWQGFFAENTRQQQSVDTMHIQDTHRKNYDEQW